MGARAVEKRRYFLSGGMTPDVVTWVLVAHQSGAKIYERTRSKRTLRLIAEIHHPEGRLKDRELNSDRPGQSYSSHNPERHSMGKSQSTHAHLAIQFANVLARELEKAWGQNKFDRLVLVSGPVFLGKLRKALNSTLRKKLMGVLDSEWIGVAKGQIVKYLRKLPE